MDRRQYLAGAAGSLTAVSGCRKWTPGLGKPVARLSVSETTAPNLDVTVDLRRTTVTTARTVKLQITWTNISTDEMRILIDKEGGTEPLYAEPPRESVPSLVLVPLHYDILRQTDTSCWVPDDGLGGDGDADITDLSPDESVQNTYEVWTVRDDPCFASGVYTAGRNFENISINGASRRIQFDVTNASE